MDNLFCQCRTRQEVKARYRELALLLHPDYNRGFREESTHAFRELNQEYQAALRWCELHPVDTSVDTSTHPEAEAEIDGYAGLSLCDRGSARLWSSLLFSPWHFKGLERYAWYAQWKQDMDGYRAVRVEYQSRPKSSADNPPQPVLQLADLAEWEDF